MKHVIHSCSEDRCFVCDGGLGLCTVCGSAEGAWTTDCPGSQIPSTVLDQVYSNVVDFVDGRWVNKLELDLSNVPPGCDWIVGYTNGGLTIHAQIGPLKECFGDTPQEALDAAIAAWESHQQPDDGLLV